MKQANKPAVAIFFLYAFLLSTNALGISFIRPENPVITNAWMQLKVKDVVRLSAKDYCCLTGKKLNLKERIAFSISKREMKKAARKNPDISLSQYMMDKKDMQLVWIIVLGILIVLLIAIMLALLGSAG